MRRNTFILVLALAAGCGWIDSYLHPKDKVIFPTEEYRVPDTEPVFDPEAQTRRAGPASEPASGPSLSPEAAPAIVPPAPESQPAPLVTQPAASEPVARPVVVESPGDPTPAPESRPFVRPTTYRVLGAGEVVSAAMLQVNDKFITLEQVLHPIRQKLQAAAKGAGEQQFRQDALVLIHDEIRRQVENTLLTAEADLRLAEEEKKALDEEVRKNVRQAVADEGDGSRAKLDERLRQEGTTLDDWQEEMRRGLTVQFYAARRFNDRIVITRQLLWDYYRAHPDEFRAKETVQMQLIAAPFKSFLPASRPAAESDYFLAGKLAKEQIDKAAAALAKGDDFAAVAKAYSRDAMADKGGIWPVMEKGSFRASAVEEAALAQKLGEVSQVIEGVDGYYIVKTLALAPAQEKSFEEAQPRIEDALRRQQYRKITQEYLDKMQARTTIQAAEKFEQTALDAAVKLYVKPKR